MASLEDQMHDPPMAKKATKQSRVKPLLICPKRKRGEMCLFGIEPESDIRDVYTFECDECGALEVRGVRVKWAAPWAFI
jgi:hypothetical protein